MNTTDTIAAPASAVSGAVAVIRISGERALAAAQAVWHGKAKLDAPEISAECSSARSAARRRSPYT